MIAAYLNFTTIIVALVLACLLVGLVVGIHGQERNLQICIDRGWLLCIETHQLVFDLIQEYMHACTSR